MKRRQFPVRLAHEKIKVYLPNPVFSHGQLYEAFSQDMSKENYKILLTEKSIMNIN